jgi:hypothetical protein
LLRVDVDEDDDVREAVEVCKLEFEVREPDEGVEV